jgi:predicted HD superfamily hydrolase involved in NAD metabolism
VHQYTSADKAHSLFGVNNPDVLDAIRYHTTGKPNMTKLGKIVYLADKIESSRIYDGVEDLRYCAYKDIDKGFVRTLKLSFAHTTECKQKLDILTKITLSWYNAI